jgi:hypothetical protein
MSPQTDYSATPDDARPGGLYDLSPHAIDSCRASADVREGFFVTRDGTTYPDLVKVPAASADITDLSKIRGVALRDAMIPNSSGATQVIPANTMFPVLKQGRAWVTTDQNVVVTDPVYVRYTAAGNGLPGMVRKDNDGGKAALLASGRFLKAGSADGLVPVEFSLP